MGDVIGWLGLGLTTLGLILAGMTYVQAQIKELRTDMERQAERQAELTRDELHAEQTLRREADDRETRLREEGERRMVEQISAFTQVATAVTKMGSAMEHLTEKFGDHQRNHERAMEELKVSIRSVEQKIGTQTWGGPRSRQRETPRP